MNQELLPHNTTKMSAMIRNIRTFCFGLVLLATLGMSGDLSAQTVTKQLYLSDGLTLDRIDPVASADGTTSQTVDILKTGVTAGTTVLVNSGNNGDALLFLSS